MKQQLTIDQLEFYCYKISFQQVIEVNVDDFSAHISTQYPLIHIHFDPASFNQLLFALETQPDYSELNNLIQQFFPNIEFELTALEKPTESFQEFYLYSPSFLLSDFGTLNTFLLKFQIRPSKFFQLNLKENQYAVIFLPPLNDNTPNIYLNFSILYIFLNNLSILQDNNNIDDQQPIFEPIKVHYDMSKIPICYISKYNPAYSGNIRQLITPLPNINTFYQLQSLASFYVCLDSMESLHDFVSKFDDYPIDTNNEAFLSITRFIPTKKLETLYENSSIIYIPGPEKRLSVAQYRLLFSKYGEIAYINKYEGLIQYYDPEASKLATAEMKEFILTPIALNVFNYPPTITEEEILADYPKSQRIIIGKVPFPGVYPIVKILFHSIEDVEEALQIVPAPRPLLVWAAKKTLSSPKPIMMLKEYNSHRKHRAFLKYKGDITQQDIATKLEPYGPLTFIEASKVGGKVGFKKTESLNAILSQMPNFQINGINIKIEKENIDPLKKEPRRASQFVPGHGPSHSLQSTSPNQPLYQLENPDDTYFPQLTD